MKHKKFTEKCRIVEYSFESDRHARDSTTTSDERQNMLFGVDFFDGGLQASQNE
jgi:hypothetical protein